MHIVYLGACLVQKPKCFIFICFVSVILLQLVSVLFILLFDISEFSYCGSAALD